MSSLLLSLSNDNKSPDWHHPLYRVMAPLLEMSNDVYNGLQLKIWTSENFWDNSLYAYVKRNRRTLIKNALDLYLPSNEAESSFDYIQRLKRSLFQNFYKPCIKGFTGLLSEIQLSDEVHPSLLQFQDDVDLEGRSLRAFLNILDIRAFLDGWCGVIVDYYTPEIGEKRPFFNLIPKRNIVNLKWADVVNKELSLLVVKSIEEIDDDYGVKKVERYREYRPGYFALREREIDNFHIPGAVEGGPLNLVIEKDLVDTAGNLLEKIPFVFYSRVTETEHIGESPNNPLGVIPPFLNLAFANISHFQISSDYDVILHKINLPVACVRGATQRVNISRNDENNMGYEHLAAPPLTLGANTCIDLPEGGDFFFAEPQGNAIGATRQRLLDLEAYMLKQTVSFFGSAESKGMTDTEASLRASQVKSTITQMAIDKESACQQMFYFWALWDAAYMGEKDRQNEEVDATVTVDRSLLKNPIQDKTLQIFLDMVAEGRMDEDTLIETLVESRLVASNVTVAELKERIEKAKRKAEVEKEKEATRNLQMMQQVQNNSSDVLPIAPNTEKTSTE